ncbi:hypothetical protein GGI42DRAFT_63024 [Trichoderma sp. SZMC 28013]
MKTENGRNAYSATVHQRVIAECAQKTEAVGLLFNKLDSLGHVFLSNEMGLRKTKTFAATVEAMARDIESKASPGDAVYFPTLVLNPVPTIHQTHAEFKRNFPGLNVVLYYSGKSQARKFGGAHVIEKGQFLRFLKKLDTTDPASVRVVILTTYSTIQRRNITKISQKFFSQLPTQSAKSYSKCPTQTIPQLPMLTFAMRSATAKTTTPYLKTKPQQGSDTVGTALRLSRL